MNPMLRAIVIVLSAFGGSVVPAFANLPVGWASTDVGAVGAAGSSSSSSPGAFIVHGAGADVWGNADAFHFSFTRLTGDGSIVTRVVSLEAVADWTKAGVMMRDTLDANARHAFMLVSPRKGLAFQRRVMTGGTSANTSGALRTAPVFLRLTRTGSTVRASWSGDGAAWTDIGSESIVMSSTIYVGVAVSSHAAGTLATATFAQTVVSGATGSGQNALPVGWATTDIGEVGASGAATGTSGGAFTVRGAGADVWSTADAFRFAYTTLTGDGEIVSRVTSEEAVSDWTKAGVMMRDTLLPQSRHAFMLVSPRKGLAFQRRDTTGGVSSHVSAGAGAAPVYVRLTRAGNSFTAYRSSDGTTWTRISTQTIAMATTIQVGLAVSSHVSGVTATAAFTSTVVSAATQPPQTTLRVLHWNTHHGGVGSDGRYDPQRIVSWVVRMAPDIISFNEVDDASQANGFVQALKVATGDPWTAVYAATGTTMVLTRLPVTGSSKCVYFPSGGWDAAHASILVNGKPVNIWSAHLSVDDPASRVNEVKALQSCAQTWPEARILAGDYNMQYGSAEYQAAVDGYRDAWLEAKSLGTAANFPGNCDGCTRSSRIDYIFTSAGAGGVLTLQSVEVFDTRDANGVTPSDHKPMVAAYAVK